jgi:hypothetical protein
MKHFVRNVDMKPRSSDYLHSSAVVQPELTGSRLNGALRIIDLQHPRVSFKGSEISSHSLGIYIVRGKAHQKRNKLTLCRRFTLAVEKHTCTHMVQEIHIVRGKLTCTT